MQILHDDNYNVERALWDAPRWIQEHCRTVVVSDRTQIIATIQSWTPVEECHFNFIKIGAQPDTTEDRFIELKNSFIGTLSHLVNDIPVDPTHEPLNFATALPTINEAAEEVVDQAAGQTSTPEFDDLNIDNLNLEGLWDSEAIVDEL